jgi:hypothetical protein
MSMMYDLYDDTRQADETQGDGQSVSGQRSAR